MIRPLKHILILLALVPLAGCRGVGSERAESPGTGQTLTYAENITLSERDGWTEARLVNPWNRNAELQELALVPRETDPEVLDIPESHTVVRIPLKKSLVTTTVLIGLLEELGTSGNIAGVSDVPYVKSKDILEKLKSGEIVNCGAWMAPDIERIVKLNPDAILLSPYQDGGNYGHLTDLHLPIVYTADYMEDSPLGRAEWMKFYGMLYGADNAADSLFNKVEADYRRLACLADSLARSEGRPAVMIDTPYMGLWYAHGRGSANDTFIRDAGGSNPFTDVVEGTTVGLSPEKYFMEAHDADVWIQRYASPVPLTLARLKADNPMYPRFKAYKNGNVWGCNTDTSLFYEETPFHPEYLLSDLVDILHPGHMKVQPRYFKRVPRE